jgi:hypothetical protein
MSKNVSNDTFLAASKSLISSNSCSSCSEGFTFIKCAAYTPAVVVVGANASASLYEFPNIIGLQDVLEDVVTVCVTSVSYAQYTVAPLVFNICPLVPKPYVVPPLVVGIANLDRVTAPLNTAE